MKNLFTFAGILALSLCSIPFTSCSDDDEDVTPVTPVATEKTFEVSLTSSAGTNCMWVWANRDEAAADSIGYSKAEHKFDEGHVGYPITETYKFKVKAEGCDSVVFQLIELVTPPVVWKTSTTHFEK